MQVGPDVIDAAPAGVCIDPAERDVPGEDLNGMAEALLRANARFQHGTGPELLPDPVHPHELRRRNLDSISLTPQNGLDTVDAALLSAIVLDHIVDDDR